MHADPYMVWICTGQVHTDPCLYKTASCYVHEGWCRPVLVQHHTGLGMLTHTYAGPQ